MSEAMKAIGKRIADDPRSHCTSDPLFIVFEKTRTPPLADGYGAFSSWVDTKGGDYTEADEAKSAALFERSQRGDSTGKWELYSYDEIDRFVTACFTREGAENYVARNSHNLKKPFIYVESTYRNYEMNDIREYLVGLSKEANAS